MNFKIFDFVFYALVLFVVLIGTPWFYRRISPQNIVVWKCIGVLLFGVNIVCASIYLSGMFNNLQPIVQSIVGSILVGAVFITFEKLPSNVQIPVIFKSNRLFVITLLAYAVLDVIGIY